MKHFLIALTLLVTPSLSHAFEYFDGGYVEFFDPGVCAPSGGFFNCTGSIFSDSFHFGFAVAGLLYAEPLLTPLTKQSSLRTKC